MERDVELERVGAAVATFGGVLVIEGEAGIGKSALLRVAVELAREGGARVLGARGGVLERDFGYGVARQLFERVLRAASPVVRRRWLAGAAALAAPVLGLEAPGSGVVIDDPAFAAQHGLYWLAVNLAAEGGLVLAVDDLHWVDLASLRWLVYLGRRLEGLPLLVLGAWRTGEPDAPEELLAALGGERVVPAPLSAEATGRLVSLRLGRDCDDATAHACHAGTRGNPFLVCELAGALATDAHLPVDPERVNELGAVAVARHVRARLGGLRESDRQVAAAAAVLEAEVLPRQVAVLTGVPVAEVAVVCDRLGAARILTGGGAVEFVHPLVRAGVYDALTPARRAALHRGAADLLDSEGMADRAAVHLLAAERAGDAAVVERLMSAAERALRRGAVEEAVVLSRRALEEPPAAEMRFSVLMALAHAEWLAGDHSDVAHARSALELARTPEEREAAAHALTEALIYANRPQEALEALDAAAEALREATPDGALRLTVDGVAYSLMLPRPPRGVGRHAKALLDRVETGSLSEQTLRAAIAVQGATSGSVPAHEAAGLAGAALRQGQLLPQSRTFGLRVGFYMAATSLAECERLDECTEWLTRGWEVATRAGSAEVYSMAVYRAQVAWHEGDVRLALEEARFALSARGAIGHKYFIPLALSYLVFALVEQNRLEAARVELLDRGLAEGTTWMWHVLIPARVSLALARGEVDAASEQLESAPPERVALPLQIAPAEVAVALASGERDQARERALSMLSAAGRFGAAGASGIAHRLVGLATGGAEGLDHLGAAVQWLERSPRRLELARALVDLGAALRRAKRRAEAREPLRRGLDLAQRCHGTVLAEWAEEELRATGARPRRLTLTGVDSLTPSELRVARLAAEGRSNREIAQALFVTTATIETHLSHVFQKLGVGGRDELSVALAAGG